jgi:HEPN domain-containing protein
MNVNDMLEWLRMADDDFDSAKILNESARKHHEIICYHCAQAIEKYLKGYLIYQDVVPPKTHDLLFLNKCCIEKDERFEEIKIDCGYINRYCNDIRYPHKYEVTEADVHYSLKAVEKIKSFSPIMSLRNSENHPLSR